MTKTKYRDMLCAEVSTEYVDKEVKLAGWVDSTRNHGGILFISLRDSSGIVQLITEDIEKYKDLVRESTICVTGLVKRRIPNMVNPNMKTGEIEVEIKTLEVLGKCNPVLPFEIKAPENTSEDTRLKYRYLDLRNPKHHDNIVFRSKVISYLRNLMTEMGFLEVQTPIITASSPEGARDFIIPSRVHKGKFYALPQAPQIFKQLLMVSGFDKYFQIAPCFRDEDPRSDRLYGEFYQLDLEMSFAEEEDVLEVGSKIFYDTFTHFSDKKVSPLPFRRIPFEEAMSKYGSDKPDLRNPLIIEDVTDVFKNTTFEAYMNKKISCIKVQNCTFSNSGYNDMLKYAESLDFRLGYIKVNEDESINGSIAKFLSDEEKKELVNKLDLKVKDAVFFIAGEKMEKKAGQIRIELGNRLNLIDNDRYEFCIVNDFPFYEEGEDGSVEFTHNPFSMPQGGMDALLNMKPFDIKAYQYDFVCNGLEMASGGVRNHSTDILKKAFEIAGYPEEEIKRKFTSLYTAFQYGAPPHAGMAPGIDRMIMLLLDETNIREVSAFPMSASAQDLMMGSPSEVDEKQLREAHIKIR